MRKRYRGRRSAGRGHGIAVSDALIDYGISGSLVKNRPSRHSQLAGISKSSILEDAGTRFLHIVGWCDLASARTPDPLPQVSAPRAREGLKLATEARTRQPEAPMFGY